MRKKVYISGPISKGNWDRNFDQASQAHYELAKAGFAPLNPMLTMKLPWCHSKEFSHADWLDMDIPWVRCADAVLRLPGASDGADREVAEALKCGVPVFTDIGSMEQHFIDAEYLTWSEVI